MDLANSDVLQALKNITATLQAFWPVILKLSYLGGFCFICGAIIICATQNNRMMMQSSISIMPSKGAIMSALAGIILLNVPAIIFHISDSIFRHSSLSVLSYKFLQTGVTVTDTIGVYVSFAVAIIIMIGLCAVIKSGFLIKSSSDNPQALWAAINHCVFGSLVVNISLLMTEIGETLGGSYKSTIDTFF